MELLEKFDWYLYLLFFATATSAAAVVFGEDWFQRGPGHDNKMHQVLYDVTSSRNLALSVYVYYLLFEFLILRYYFLDA